MTVTVVPEGVSSSQVESALDAMRKVVGAEWVHTGESACGVP